MIVEIAVTLVTAALLIYYVRGTVQKVVSKYFDVKNDIEEYNKKLMSLENEMKEKLKELNSKIKEIETALSSKDVALWEFKSISEKLAQIEKAIKEQEKSNTKFTYELGSVKKEVHDLKEEVEGLKDELKDSLKREIIAELEEEIERLEDVIEKRKESEVQEFIELLTSAINLEPEKLQNGLMEAKRGLLSLRDLAKVYVLTGKGQEEFAKLRDNLISLLKNLRKLAVIAVPDDSVYSKFNDIIVKLKRLELPMKVTKDGKTKELNPEKSFIRIHQMVYALAGELDKIAEIVNEPIPVTPIEKEFYEKLRVQFEELKKLEEQIQKLMLRLEGKKEEPTKNNLKDNIEEILKELNL
ncbi:hypothetical protein [Thermococcus sp. LS2]|uniref:hypothetical protein n=1 Tax=Thermococcus sp. LS2 TaxID=1638260 RepID=UPI00143CADA7|nr:hypothetical protein [Thermococcus sp. LS2]NJE13525.1 hypothetical protein [Thermococcus sp. LS2]